MPNLRQIHRPERGACRRNCAEHAVERLCEDPRAFGETDKAGDVFCARRDELVATLNALIDRHDDLDRAQLAMRR